ncbi:MAG: tRNA uridine-5-carboxymethylaminomethyl(34) synthesis GTPase MnmE [Alphaproteobacteria bacterium]|jgi:tRNA modification GTPase|nr:tRNA uridine-5-carboxymethylaminomethyl(34) synthesis GTPase MnmE [Alphaproteobacteria bacterium]
MADTIFAVATGAGRAAIAIVRLSGPQAGAALEALTGRPLPPPRHAALRTLREPGSGAVLDRGLVLWFPGPHSASGEDMAEFHVHGGRAVLAGLCAALAALPGLRPAEPGEFSRRAFEAGKLDLTEVEAIADLVDAETRAQQRQALRQMDGALSRLVEDWRTRLVRVLAHLEADLDFPDEDLPAGIAPAARAGLEALAAEMAAQLADDRRGERLREGLAIALIGPPNAGKSTLLNRLARREAAIVSERAGTTRDVIEVHMELDGLPVILADTAGLRETADAIEDEGVRRARARATAADVRVLVLDAGDWPPPPGLAELADADTLVVANKADRAPVPPDADFAGRPVLPLSALTGDGLPALLDRLAAMAAARLGSGEAPALTRTRHRTALADCYGHLQAALAGSVAELVAEDVRLATRALGHITGRVDVEDLLDVIFRDLCIGK